MSCSRPLDPADIEALAAGGEAELAPGAQAHVKSCPVCSAAVAEASRFSGELQALGAASLSPDLPDLTDRIVRLRPFSRRERSSFGLWRGSLFLAAGIFAAGFLALALPGFSARDQAGLGAAALAPLTGIARSLTRWVSEVAQGAPAALEGLAFALRRDLSLGAAFLLLLIPALFGLRRVLVRARTSR